MTADVTHPSAPWRRSPPVAPDAPADQPQGAPQLAAILRRNIRDRMGQAGMGVTAAAAKAGISQGSFSDFLNGKRDALQLETVAAIAGVLEATIGELLGEASGAVELTVEGDSLPHRAITPDPDNPRRAIDLVGLAGLAESIAAFGLLVPLLVKPSGGIIDGERRWLAIGQLIKAGGWDSDKPVPVVLGRELAGGDRLIAGLVANLQREDITPLEEARAIKTLIADHGLTTAAIAAATGLGQRHVQLRLALVDKLGGPARKALQSGEIPLAAARELTAAPLARQKTALPLIAKGAYGWETARDIRRSLQADMVPVGRNLFALEAWTGTIVEDPDEPDKQWFQDRALFLTLQREAAAAKVAELEAAGCAWVELVDRSLHQVHHPWDFDQDKRATTAGAVVEIQFDLAVQVHRGLTAKAGTAEAAPAEVQAALASPATPQPVKVTHAHLIACAQAKTESLQAALAARPDLALRAAIVALLAGSGMIRLRIGEGMAHDDPDTSTLAKLAGKWSALFKKPRDTWIPRASDVLAVGDGAAQAKAWAALCHMKDKEAGALHAVLMARLCGSWAGPQPELGDGPLALAMAKTLGLEAAQGLVMDEAFLQSCGKPLLLEIARSSGEAHGPDALAKLKVKDLIALILADIEAGALADYVPPTARFGTPAKLTSLLPKKG